MVVLFFLLKHKNIMRTHKTHNFYGKSVVTVSKGENSYGGDTMSKWCVAYKVGSTLRFKNVIADTEAEAVKKANVKHIVSVSRWKEQADGKSN